MDPTTVVVALATLTAGLATGYAVCRLRLVAQISQADSRVVQLQTQLQQIEDQGKALAETFRREAELKAKDELFAHRETLGREFDTKRSELREQERRLDKREDALEQGQSAVSKKERQIEAQATKLAEKRALAEAKAKELDERLAEQDKKLQEISGLSRERAETIILDRVEADLTSAVATRIQKHEEMLKATCEERSKQVLAMSIQRYASSHTADSTTSSVDIPSDDMKGRIIGREGRNIRTFEKATGVDVIVDDTPGVVIVSAFDNVRRETARLALGKLIADGRIHPSRIEEVVKETQMEMEKHVLEVGKAAAMDVGVSPLHEKLMQLLGRLKFRTSYSQNVLQHSLEVAHLAGMMADELKLNGTLARRCGLLHDIGKAADHEMEGGHPKIGAELAKRYGETREEVLHAIAGHHDEVTVDHIYTVLVAAADAISASRPGARRETLEKYVKRLEHLEAVASGFPGVVHAYAIQAGREVRVIANADDLNDEASRKVCHDIARAIEEQMDYPGEIKVTVVRETRSVEFAR